jgi:S1-C subfamily serine protease
MLQAVGQPSNPNDQGVIETALDSVVGLYIERPMGEQDVMPSLGSGVIVDKTGLVITNAHVVDHAQSIVAQLNDGTKTFVTVVGVDVASDIALLQLEPRASYQAITFGQSYDLKIGTPVTAIGNPFGLTQSVTAGIVSGLHRSDQSPKIQDYIQLDAPINPGNSGGALIDDEGRLIGINSAIITSPGGGLGNIGIGFAIPVEIALPIYLQLRASGHTTPGYLGVVSQSMTEALSQVLGVSSHKGVIITDVIPGSPAETAGIASMDIITHLNKVPIHDSEHLRSLVVAQGQDSTMELTVYKSGQFKQPRTIKAVTKRPMIAMEVPSVFGGVFVDEYSEMSLTGDRRAGLRITHISKDSPALLSGIIPGDIIIAINNKPVTKMKDIEGLITPKQNKYLLKIERDSQAIYIGVVI